MFWVKRVLLALFALAGGGLFWGARTDQWSQPWKHVPSQASSQEAHPTMTVRFLNLKAIRREEVAAVIPEQEPGGRMRTTIEVATDYYAEFVQAPWDRIGISAQAYAQLEHWLRSSRVQVKGQPVQVKKESLWVTDDNRTLTVTSPDSGLLMCWEIGWESRPAQCPPVREVAVREIVVVASDHLPSRLIATDGQTYPLRRLHAERLAEILNMRLYTTAPQERRYSAQHAVSACLVSHPQAQGTFIPLVISCAEARTAVSWK